MVKLIQFIMKQKLFVNLVVVLILLVGIVSMMRINREAIPEVNFDMVSILTIYPGGSPDEIEQLITIPLERRLREVDGLDKVRSYNIENVSVIVIYIEDVVADKKQVVEDIKDAVALEDKLPDKAEQPIVEEIKTDKTQVISLAVYGKRPGVSYQKVREAADELEDNLYNVNGVAQVEYFGFEDREYLVEVNPASLKYYRMGLNKVINTLRMRNMDVPGGTLKIGDKEFILRTKGQYRNADEIRNTALMVNDVGFATRIRDVAKISDTFEDPKVLQRYNGKKAIVLKIWKKRSADEIDMVDRLKSLIKTYKPLHHEDVALELYNDMSKYTRTRLEALVINAITGFALLALILFVLLGGRMSGIVMGSLPVAFMLAFMAMKSSDLTLNIITMFAMLMVLGMIVDFGIVVSENSYRYMEEGMEKIKAIQKGVSEVVWPVTVTFLCISTAFAPLLFLTGIMGKFIRSLPIVLIICLAGSWFAAMFIMPTHLSIFAKVNKKKGKSIDLQTHLEEGLFGRFQAKYRFLLNLALNHRYITLGILVALLVFSLVLVKMEAIGFEFMPTGGEESITVTTYMPQGTNLEANLREMRSIEKIIRTLPKKELDALHTAVGEESTHVFDPKPGEATHKTTFSLYLSPEKHRDRTAHEINKALRKTVLAAQKKGDIARSIQFKFEVARNGPPVGKPINVEIRGKDFSTLKKIANEYISYLNKTKGINDISLDLEEGKQEFRYVINDVMAARTGVSVYDAAMALNASYYGAVATSVRQGKDDIDIRVRFPESARKNLYSLQHVMIGTQMGGLIPLDTVTEVKKQPGYSQINRLNYRRIVQVQAGVDTKVMTSKDANDRLMKKFMDIGKRYPGYFITYGGEEETSQKSMAEMGDLYLVAALIIYIILAVFFESLILPLVVMSAVPFALVGVILALLAHREPLSFMSTLGLFSLVGVIVSNTLVLVQFINNQREQGLTLKESLLEGGVIRLRPVLLTSGTTVLALIPTIYGLGGKDYFVAPLGLAFGYGLIFATFITLVLIPCFYHIAEDLKKMTARVMLKFGISMREEIFCCEDEAVSGINMPDVSESINPVLKRPVKKKKKK